MRIQGIKRYDIINYKHDERRKNDYSFRSR